LASYKRSEITKEKIESVARGFFIEKGYTSTTTRDICNECGISISRINYHFSSKAELASDICRELLRNFYTQFNEIIKANERYSFVSEAVCLRFLIDMLTGELKTESNRFYQDLAREGIFADVFTSVDRSVFADLTRGSSIRNMDSVAKKIGVYSNVFAASLSTIEDSWEDVLDKCAYDRTEARKLIQDCYAGLFMQMLDIPHDAQRAMLDMSNAYYKLMNVEISGLTDVKITMPSMLSLYDKVKIIEPSIGKSKIKLKSNKDRTDIEIDSTSLLLGDDKKD